MRQILMRHGVAVDPSDPHCPPDPERPLTKEGKQRTRRAAKGLAELKLPIDRIWTSPYLRTVQTAEIAAEVLGIPPSRVSMTDALLPHADAVKLALQLTNSAETILCVGHAPIIDALLAELVGTHKPLTSMKKAGVAVIEDGKLQALYEPKFLSELAG